ncbi:MAG: 2Fe-2S iron-sulfur cluster-binding protein [Thermoguttaceae bacterium]
MPIVLIDGQELEIPAGTRINAIEAARRAGIEIPHYCWHPGLSVVGSCRMCLVETGQRDAATGKITMQPKLVPGCSTLVGDGMVVVTRSQQVKRARAMVEEGLLLRHPIDCPICDKAGECLLQDYHFEHGQDARRADLHPFTSRRRDLGDVDLFVDRCILCSRCVRFTAEISGTNELMVTGRGAEEEIDVAPGRPLRNNLSGNVVDLCPVGALADKDFLYQQRVWFLRRHKGVCTGCAVGCSIWIEENQDHIYRLKPRENALLNKWWMCNEGRYGYRHVHDPRRLLVPRRREDGKTVELATGGLAAELGERLRRAGRLAGVLSPFLTVEEAYLLSKLLRAIDPRAMLVLGPVPAAGGDERFPGFLVDAEKCPNRRGVAAVLAHFTHRVGTLEQLLPALDAGQFGGVWVAGGYKSAWIDAATAERFRRLALLVVQDLFPSPLSELAGYELPAAAFAERDGSYVNRHDRLQTVAWAIRPPWGVPPEGELYWQLCGGRGLYNSRGVLDEIAREIIYFSAAAGPIPELGLDLKVNLLAKDKGGSVI